MHLKKVMEENGFTNYAEEWWHYTLKDEPFKERYFDFDIRAASRP
jgi:D-alanyl-D-alanine dipeptidase